TTTPTAAAPAPAPRTPLTLPEADGPYSETLPYPKAEPPAVTDDDVGKVLVGLPAIVAGNNRRDLVIPLAAGLLVFVLAMHALYLSRRAGQVPMDPEFDL
ncbi:MAG: hypothetical protein ACRDZ3_16665, partial [Acidimicrobiia bacterium]